MRPHDPVLVGGAEWISAHRRRAPIRPSPCRNAGARWRSHLMPPRPLINATVAASSRGDESHSTLPPPFAPAARAGRWRNAPPRRSRSRPARIRGSCSSCGWPASSPSVVQPCSRASAMVTPRTWRRRATSSSCTARAPRPARAERTPSLGSAAGADLPASRRRGRSRPAPDGAARGVLEHDAAPASSSRMRSASAKSFGARGPSSRSRPARRSRRRHRAAGPLDAEHAGAARAPSRAATRHARASPSSIAVLASRDRVEDRRRARPACRSRRPSRRGTVDDRRRRAARRRRDTRASPLAGTSASSRSTASAAAASSFVAELHLRAGSASAARASRNARGPCASSTSASVVKLPSDFDIFSPPTFTMPACIQCRANAWPARLGLGALVLVVREHEVVAAAVDVEALAEDLERHRRALDVPARPARAPRRVPGRLARLRRLPQREVDRAALRARRPRRARRALEQLVERAVRQRAVVREACRPRSTRPGPRSRTRGPPRPARAISSSIWSMYSVACGMSSGRRTSSRSICVRSTRPRSSAASSGSVVPRSAARAMILSSTSVTLLTYVTSKPRHSR